MKPLVLAVSMLLTSALPAPAAEARTFALTVTVPTAAWRLKIVRVDLIGETPWVVARLTPPKGFAAEVISDASDEIAVKDAPEGKARYFVLGKNWEWKNDEPYEFVADEKKFLKKLDARKDAKRLY